MTAAHVLYGVDSPAHAGITECAADLTPQVGVGATLATVELATHHSLRFASLVPGCRNPSDKSGIDFALVFLDPKEPFIEGVNITRPSLDPNVGGTIGSAGWSAFLNGDFNAPQDTDRVNFRYGAFFNGLDLTPQEGHPDHSDAPGSPPVGHRFERVRTDKLDHTAGDSGGPLFHVRADGSRDVFGVLAAFGGCADVSHIGNNCEYWTDITRGANRQFILDHAQDAGRTDRWYRSHGKVRGDYWYGEVDYVGYANTQLDADRDHWIDEHDNCPC